MSAVMAIATTGLRRFMRDRSNWFFVFVFPMVLVVLIGLQFSDSGSSGRVVVIGATDVAQDVTDRLRDLDVSVETGPADDLDSARAQVARGRLDAIVVLDDNVAASLAEGQPTDVTVLAGPQASGQATAATIRTALASVGDRLRAEMALQEAGLSATQARTAFDATSGQAGPRVTVSRAGDGLAEEFAGLGQFDLGASQQLSLFVFLASLAGATALIESRQLGVTRRELAAPTTPLRVVVGETLGRFVIALVQGLYIIVGTAVLFDVAWGGPIATGAVLVAFCAVSAAAAILFGSLLDNANVAGGVGVGLGLVLAALGGSMLPLELFPDGMLVVSSFTPHHWAYEAYATIQRNGGGVGDVLPQLGVLSGMAVVLLAIGSLLLRRATERAL